MRRFNSLFLNLIVVIGVALGTVPLGLSAASTSRSMSGTVSVAGAAAPGQASQHGKHKHKQKHNDRQKDRKHKDRKRDRQRDRKEPAEPPVELPTGVLPDADTVDPDVDTTPVSAKDHYIVLLKSGTVSAQNAASDIASDTAGVTPTFVYHYVFEGFAAVIPPDKLDAVRNDPRVLAIEPDSLVTVSAQIIPTGVRRIEADQNATAHIDGADERVDVDVAVIDTAGKGLPADLNQHAWANCTPSHNNADDHGHGTHVSGTIGAIDDGNGVVGVAPGARIWNIRVLANGFGLESWIICGLDLVTWYSTDQGDGLGDIEVANMSLGGGIPAASLDDVCGAGAVDAEHEAICRTVTAGVTVVVAAGNETDDANNHRPAAYPEVITVSALVDSNGQPGGGGPATTRGPDDSLANFSNFGADVDLAAPGVNILSTVPTGSCPLCDPSGLMSISGTSMASPHVAGAAALYLAANPGDSPTDVKIALLDGRVTGPIPGDDHDTFDEGILNVGPGSGIGTTVANSQSQSSAEGKRHTSSQGTNAKQTRGHHHSKKKR